MDVPRISTEEAKRMLDTDRGTVFLDTRSPQAWGSATTMIPGAKRVPANEVDSYLQEIPRDRPIITYCT